MFCEECGTPFMLTYSTVQRSWMRMCIKCGRKEPAREPEGLAQEAGVLAQKGFSFFASQDFERAEQCFEGAIRLCADEPSYRWALLLSRYGIKYCKTPINEGQAFGYPVNIWKRALPETMLEDTPEYEALCDCAGMCGPEWTQYYREEREAIDEELRQIRELERRGERCDIFLCYKDTNDDYEPTQERTLLNWLYAALPADRVRIFYAPVSLRNRRVYDYEGVIYNALRTAQMMVVFAGSRSNVESPWVQSEWMRFMNWDREHRKVLLTCTVGQMRPGQLPGRLSSIQSDLRADPVDQVTAESCARGIMWQYYEHRSTQGADAGAPQTQPVAQKAEPQTQKPAQPVAQRAEPQTQKPVQPVVQKAEPQTQKPAQPVVQKAAPVRAQERIVKKPTPEELFQRGRSSTDNEEKIRCYREAAEQGHAEAQCALGYSYYYGQDVPEDAREAFKWFQKAAEQGLAKAQYALAVCYYYGIGTPDDERDWNQAYRWYLKAAEQGLACAQYKVGDLYYYGEGTPYEEQSEEKAAVWYRKAAEQGHAEAQNMLAHYYFYHEPPDYGKAVQWYQKAAEQGFVLSQIRLGEVYSEGSGVQKDMVRAIKWYQKAAEQGDSRAQIKLGDIYRYGQGVPVNYEEAQKWYQRLAEQKIAASEVARKRLDELREELKWSAKPKAPEGIPARAKQGNAGAQYKLGVSNNTGNGVPEGLEQAAKWYQKAAEQGDADAQYKLGSFYWNGIGVPTDMKQAAKWYQRAAEQGHAQAQYELGECYWNGMGVPELDTQKAAMWYRKAAEQGVAEAQFSLAVCYAEGEGVPEDVNEAIRWCQKAADQGNDDARELLAALRDRR